MSLNLSVELAFLWKTDLFNKNKNNNNNNNCRIRSSSSTYMTYVLAFYLRCAETMCKKA